MNIGHRRNLLRILPTFLISLWASHRRNQGRYDRRTRLFFHLAWHRRRTPAALLDYLLFRRDLGLSLTPSRSAMLIKHLDHFRRKQDLALALVAEANPESLKSVPKTRIARHARRMAPLADAYREPGHGEEMDWLADLNARQDAWQNMFSADFANTSICLVGNASTIRGANLGAWIDSHDRVVRFNRHRGPDSSVKDIGTHLDLWAMAPAFVPSAPPTHEPPWVVITGPDVLFRRRNWQSLRTRLEYGTPVLTVPLPIWRDLVARLQAPPSAGLLVLAWLAALRGGWRDMHAVGFGVLPARGIPYHHADPRHRPTSRHNWEQERRLLHAWSAQGLNVRHTDDAYPTNGNGKDS